MNLVRIYQKLSCPACAKYLLAILHQGSEELSKAIEEGDRQTSLIERADVSNIARANH